MVFSRRGIPWIQPLQVVAIAILLSIGTMQVVSSNENNKLIEFTRNNHVITHKPILTEYTFPNGGRELFPYYRLVALYGTPGEPALGILGEQDVNASVARVKTLAAQYQPLMIEHALPTFEIIATVASAYPTDNNDYSREVDISNIEHWADVAKDNGIYVVLDLQPGRTDFLTQAKEFEPVLKRPNVGLALDPEWRLKPTEVPLVQIGNVGIDEVNQTASWLAQLITENKLPQKLFLLHEFRADMIPERSALNTTYPELAYAVQMDGQGTQPEKLATWVAMQANAPPNLHFGWKNFTQKDSPMLTPDATMLLMPKPWYVSYQ